jgi:23S rRNA (cytosine1962-C5)-methyltransferase
MNDQTRPARSAEPAAARNAARGLTVAPGDPIPVVRLTSPVRQPLVFRKRIAEVDPKSRAGDLVAVYAPAGNDVNAAERLLGYGYYNPKATVALRMIRFATELPDQAWWERLVDRALALRYETLKIQNESDACRLIHAEADGFPGLVVDRYGDVLSAETFSLAMHQRSSAVLELLARRCGTKKAVVRTSPHALAQEGFEAPLWRSPGTPATVEIREFGTRFRIRLDESGHKTGFFCDQRENRKRLAGFCAGQSVLDLCCYSGGFSVQAKQLGAATEVTGVDLDEEALAVARENANLNQQRIRWVQADVFPWMRDAIRGGRQFDVVVLDPPKLIRNREELEEGTRKHLDLNRLAMQLVRPGGLLLSCTCAGLLTQTEFMRLLQTAAWQAGSTVDASGVSSGPGRKVRIFATSGAAGDHPIGADSPESAYLQAVWMRVDPAE